ncbi:hypothetical protein AAVH_39216, partial [Aphelenchoides avenae]
RLGTVIRGVLGAVSAVSLFNALLSVFIIILRKALPIQWHLAVSAVAEFLLVVAMALMGFQYGSDFPNVK